jgi:hypothetical protein
VQLAAIEQVLEQEPTQADPEQADAGQVDAGQGRAGIRDNTSIQSGM